MKNPTSWVNEDSVVNMQLLVKGMIEILPTATIDRLASVNIKERRQSVSDIISVVPNTRDRSNVIQIIPLELLSNHKVIEAIGYMVEEGRKAKLCFSPEVIRSVFDAAYGVKEKYATVSPQSEFQISDMAFLQKTLKQMLFAQLDISEGDMELFPIIWDYYALFELMPGTARSYYYDAVGTGDMTAILRSAQYCMDEGNFEVALSLLVSGYEESGDILFLEKHIELLFLLGDTEAAKKQYALLLKDFPEHSSPILRYKWHVEDDDDIDELEIIMESFYIDPKPTDIHKKLATSAKEYLNRKIDELLVAVQTMEPGMNDYQLKAELILRRMAYMEKHIFLLLDDTYLEVYLEDVKHFLLGDLDAQLLLSEFFELYPLNISQSQVRFDDIDATGKLQDSPLTHPTNLEDMAAQRLTYIACRFFESRKEEIFQNIAILGEKSLYNYLDIESKARDIVRYLEKESKDMTELFPDANVIYHYIIRSLDENYGTYFRRHIQYLARHPYRTEWNKYPEILESIPLAGMFFLMEAILSHSAWDIDIDMCIHKFSIDLLPLPETLLFAQVLMDNGFCSEGIVYLSRLDWIFFEPEFIALIVDGIGHMENSKAARQVVEHLDAVCQGEYKEKSFFTFVNKSAKKLQEELPAYPRYLDSLDIATGHIHMFRGNDKKALRKFTNAASRESVEGIIQCARILESSLDRKDDALDMYIRAFSLGQNYKSTEILQSIISLCTRLEKPDLRNHYIQIALHNKSLDSWDLFSLDLYGNDEDKYRALRWVTSDDGVWTNATEHIILEEFIDNNITQEILSTELDLKSFLLSSYIKGVEQNDSKMVDPKSLLQHWNDVMSISFDLDESAVAAVCLLYREFIDIPESLSDGEEDGRSVLDDLVYTQPYDNSFQELSILMHAHAHEFCILFGKIFSQAPKAGEEIQWKSYMEDYAVFLGMVVSVFRRIPEGGPYVERWQGELDKTLYVMNGTNPSHMPLGDHTYLQ